MANIVQDDVRALNILSSGQLEPSRANELQGKLGLDDDDLRAWQLSTTANPEMRDEIQAKVLDKVRTQKGDRDTALEAGVKGALQGVTFGFSDEIESGFMAGLDTLKGEGDFSKRYDERIKKEREELKKLEEKFPVQFISGELIGALAVPIPGTGAIRGTKALTKLGLLGLEKALVAGAKATPKLARLAGESALQAAGKSEAEFGSKQFFEETAKGTLLGTVAGGLLGKGVQKTAELAKKGLSPTKKAAQVISSVLFDLPPNYTEKLLDERLAKKVLDPKDATDIMESIVGITKDMGKHVKALSGAAQKNLSDEPIISMSDLVKTIKSAPSVQKVQRSTLKEARNAQAALSEITADLKQRALTRKVLAPPGAKRIKDDIPLGRADPLKEAVDAQAAFDDARSLLGKKLEDPKALSEMDLKRFIQDLDEEIPWNTNEWTLKDKLFGEIRSAIDEGILKKNPEYAKAMIPVAQIMSNLTDISKSFSLKRKGFETRATDATLSKIKNFFDVAGKAKKPVTEGALAQAEKRFLGPARPRILEDIETAQIARRTQGGMAAGSKHILQGLAAGTLFGSPTFGAIAGAVKDRYGRKIGKSVIPALRNQINLGDRAVQASLKDINPDLLELLFRSSGRTLGVGQGVEAAQTPSLLPTTPQQQILIPRR